MLISCTSCHSKYLVNSADLKPDGRTVQCANCGNQWYQESYLREEDEKLLSSTLSNSTNSQTEKKESNLPTRNLPATYVKEQTVSILNSILVVIFVSVLVVGFWLIKNLDTNNLVLLKFYFDEFYFNLNLIVDDIAKIIHRIIN